MAGTDASDKDKTQGGPRGGEPSGGLLSGIGATTAGLTDEAIAAEAATDRDESEAEPGAEGRG